MQNSENVRFPFSFGMHSQVRRLLPDVLCASQEQEKVECNASV